MKKVYFIVFVLVFIVSNYLTAAEIVVEPTTPNALKAAIDAAQGGDILLLEYGGAFPFDGSVLVDTNITIKAYEKITGDARILHKPLILPLYDETGNKSSRLFDIKDDLTLINVEINGDYGDGTNARVALNVRANDVTLVIDSCVFGDFYYASIRTDNRTNLIKITNTIFLADRHLGQIDNGRSLELRGKGAGKVFLQNNTFCNATSMWFHNEKWATAASPIDTLIVDHCTFIHQMGQQPAFDIRSVKYFKFTNNIVANAMMLGSDRYSGRIITWSGGYLDSNRVSVLGPYATVTFDIVDVDSFQTVAEFHNNNIYVQKAVKDTIAKYDTKGRSSDAAIFTNDFKRVVSSQDTFFVEELIFGNAPETPFAMVKEFIEKMDTVSVADDENTWLAEINNTMEFVNYWELDMSYGTSAMSYTAAEGGFPLGDLNWYPNKKAQWENWLTGIESVGSAAPTMFRLEQNYPNPFNPVTNINFSIPEKGMTSLKVYNILGQEIATLVNEELKAGAYSYKLDGSTLSSGLYFYKLESNGQIQVKKMMLIK